ncbi:hypothetical protein HBI81_039580 [Parastagonospora nodorum]|nr:hypothetical protein HBI33_176000 [Parastagonospora nodorum]KAH6331894.1 hypothetical protein HBI37_181140 [Parastagonospora nodorum]KAH6343707.1 hypothetical protein HBI36_171900 [Parastagonospora nodorum]KAH6540626.1 hypothetical protein HBI81_039580 [Parastagonospora nodorum]
MAILEAGGRSQETFRTSKVDKAMLALCGRQYWTRTWIVQEILLAKEIFVYCGVAKVHWTTFADFFDIDNVMVSNTWGESSRISPVIESAAADIVRAKIDWNTKGSQPRPLMDLIKLCHKQQSTDIRDKIYALHGLASDTEDMVIDYDVPVEQLLVIVLKRTLASIPSTNNLDIENARIEILQTEETLRDALGIYHYIEEVDNIIYAEEQRITSKCKTKTIEATQANAQIFPHYLSWRHQILEGAPSNRFLGPSTRSVKEGVDLFHSPIKSVEA